MLEIKSDGEKIFGKILKKDEIYHGPYIRYAPDLIAVPNSETINLSTGFGKNPIEKSIDHIAGIHRQKGILTISGHGIQHDKVKANIIDLAPTILHIFGIEIPKYMDGRVLTEIFKPDSEFAKMKIRYSSYEKEMLKGRLRRLKTKKKI